MAVLALGLMLAGAATSSAADMQANVVPGYYDVSGNFGGPTLGRELTYNFKATGGWEFDGPQIAMALPAALYLVTPNNADVLSGEITYAVQSTAVFNARFGGRLKHPTGNVPGPGSGGAGPGSGGGGTVSQGRWRAEGKDNDVYHIMPWHDYVDARIAGSATFAAVPATSTVWTLIGASGPSTGTFSLPDGVPTYIGVTCTVNYSPPSTLGVTGAHVSVSGLNGGLSDQAELHAVYTDLEIAGASESTEAAPGPGVYLAVGGTPAPVKMSARAPGLSPGDAVLSVTPVAPPTAVAGDIKFWMNADGTVPAPLTWNLSSLPASPAPALYVTGTQPGQYRITLTYIAPSGTKTFTDDVLVTVVKVELEKTTTKNFSPQLGETATLNVKLEPAPPNGGYPGLYFQLEIVRKQLLDGDQHIQWIDVVPTTPALDLVRDADFSTTLSLTWNGIPDANAAQTVGPDIFAGFSSFFFRNLPAVGAAKDGADMTLTGLVKDNDVLDGSSQSPVHLHHNKPPWTACQHMNPGALADSLDAMLGRTETWSFKPLNKSYVEFVLPVP